MKNKWSWVYYDTVQDSIVLVRRPRRGVINPQYSILVFLPIKPERILTYFKLPMREFHKRFEYLGGINR